MSQSVDADLHGLPAHCRPIPSAGNVPGFKNVVSHKDVGSRGRKDADDHSNDDFFLELLCDNTEVLATSTDWLTLAYLEPLMAKKHDARINGGEKAMRTLNLF